MRRLLRAALIEILAGSELGVKPGIGDGLRAFRSNEWAYNARPQATNKRMSDAICVQVKIPAASARQVHAYDLSQDGNCSDAGSARALLAYVAERKTNAIGNAKICTSIKPGL